jgi:hypothetical protein
MYERSQSSKQLQYNDESNKKLRVVQLRSTVIYWNNIGTGTCLYRSTYRYYPHKYNIYRSIFNAGGDRRGRDRMVDGFTTTYANLSPGRWFPPVSSTNKTDSHDITEILLKVTLNTITLTLFHTDACESRE